MNVPDIVLTWSHMFEDKPLGISVGWVFQFCTRITYYGTQHIIRPYLEMPYQAAISVELDTMEVSTAGTCQEDGTILAHASCLDSVILTARKSVLPSADVRMW